MKYQELVKILVEDTLAGEHMQGTVERMKQILSILIVIFLEHEVIDKDEIFNEVIWKYSKRTELAKIQEFYDEIQKGEKEEDEEL
jgi:hypothetical protein